MSSMENTDDTIDTHIPCLDMNVVEDWNLVKRVPKLKQVRIDGWLLR